MRRDYSRSRAHLHLKDVPEFHSWLKSCGWEDLQLFPYEMLRMKHPEHKGLLIVWKRERAKEHATIQGVSAEWWRKWREAPQFNPVTTQHTFNN